MTVINGVRSEVLRTRRSIEDHVATMRVAPDLLGAALVEAGLRLIASDAQRPVSAAERKLIRAHHASAIDEDIDAHRIAPEALRHILALTTTAARKYLDHQPEACAVLDACPDDAVVKDLVVSLTRHLSNAYATASELGASAYDVAATAITNASILASENGVCLEQLATILFENIERALEREQERNGDEFI
jgi:hypothetical protein